MPELNVEGTPIHFLEKRGAGNLPVLFIHGSGGNAFGWEKVMGGLEGFHTCAVDLPGHGGSKGEGKQSIHEYTEFIRDFCNARGWGDVVLGGHSLGGGIVLDFAVRFPARLRAALLIGTGARLRVLPAALDLLKKMAEGEIPTKFQPWAFSEKAAPEVLAEGEKEWAKTSPKVRYYDMLACDQFDIMGELGKVKCPVLIACGREDRLTPIKYSEFLKDRIPGSKLEIIEGAAHMPMLENPKALSSALREFLKTLS
jgi:pimeloyl-ACP methyl ester carboxylesterase